jgi:hypothetical protein
MARTMPLQGLNELALRRAGSARLQTTSDWLNDGIMYFFVSKTGEGLAIKIFLRSPEDITNILLFYAKQSTQKRVCFIIDL